VSASRSASPHTVVVADQPAPPARDVDAVRDRCTRFLGWHGRPRPREVLLELAAATPDDLRPDHYGAGAVLEDLEAQVAELLAKPAAVFMPSGTMAQQIALRIWADRKGVRTVAFHPTCHLERHEDKAYEYLHGLHGRLVGDRNELITRKDLEQVREPLAALVLELPQRELGGRLPEWDDLVAQAEWARDSGVSLHLDGARLWETAPYYRRPYAEIAGLFDTVYVSFYKGLGGIAGCALAGPEDVIAQARVWQRRHGGSLFHLYPYALAARVGLQQRLGRMGDYYARALEIAEALRGHPDVEVVPDPPQVPMMHLRLRISADALREAALDLAEETGIWTFVDSAPSESPSWRRVELTVGDATMGFTGAEVRELLDRLLPSSRGARGSAPANSDGRVGG